jgi:hypothetical protein
MPPISPMKSRNLKRLGIAFGQVLVRGLRAGRADDGAHGLTRRLLSLEPVCGTVLREEQE